MNIRDINKFILDMEKELNLFDYSIDGVYFWKLIRLSISNTIRKRTGVSEQAHTKNKQSLSAKLKVIPLLYINTYLHGVGSRSRKVDTLIFEHPRKQYIDGEFRDIYTDPIRERVEKSGSSYELVDHPQLRKHFNRPSRERSYLEHNYISYMIKALCLKIKIGSDDINLLNSISDRINSEYGFNINIKDITEKDIKKFRWEESFYRKMLTKRGVKKVYLVVSYGKEALISACHREGVKCIELQHGVMSTYHLGYHFPDRESVPYFPHEIELFGRYWRDSVALPLKAANTPIKGYPYLNNKLKEFNNLEKIRNQVLFISQGVLGKDLSSLAVNYAKENRDKRVIYKLHPGEYSRWRDEYKALLDLPDNLIVVDNNEVNLYQYLAESTYVVGVYSTVMYEAISMACRLILVDLPGYEYLEYLINEGYAGFSTTDSSNLKDVMGNFKRNNSMESSYFFS